jgi:hypothetical protein
MHHSNDALYRLTMRDYSGAPHLMHLPKWIVENPGRGVDADSIHNFWRVSSAPTRVEN